MNNQPVFSILIPTWNNLPYLKLCIESIRKNSQFAHQIIVHINEGTDGTLEWVKAEGIDFTYSEKNVGVCLAMNSMRTLVKTDYIYFLNDDMYVLPGWDKALLDDISQLPDNRFYLSSTMIQPHDDHDVGFCWNYGDSIDTFQEEKLLAEFMKEPYNDWQGSTRPPSLVHRDIWDLVGGYSIELTPGMYSDPDFTAKLLMVGVTYLKGIGNSRVYHFETKTTTRIRKNRGEIQFLLKWGLTNSAMRRFITRQGQDWADHTQPLNTAKIDKMSRLARLKAIWIICFKGFGIARKLGEFCRHRI